jgi:hypothetical protein
MNVLCTTAYALALLSVLLVNCVSGFGNKGDTVIAERTIAGRTLRLIEVAMPDDPMDEPQLERTKYVFKLDGRDEPLHVLEVSRAKNSVDDATATPRADTRVKLLDVLFIDDSNYVVLYKSRALTFGMAVIGNVRVIPSVERPVSDIIVRDSEVHGIITDGSLRGGLGDAPPAALLVIAGKVQAFPLVEADGNWTWAARARDQKALPTEKPTQ